MAVEDPGKKMKYPKAVFFIVSNEFCERFSYYGMRTMLSLYFVDILLYTEDTATVVYHTFTMFAYFFPLLGAIIADSWLGKYRTIFYLSFIYALGGLLLSSSSVPPLHLPVRELSLLGLLLIAIGTGGIKPCVPAFGGDQFKLPEQEAYLSAFFSLFYFSINSGSLISTFITPILRKDVKCFGQNMCYPLAFLVPSILMICSLVIFVSGKRLYKIKKPEGNVILKVASCVCHAIGRKMKSKAKREHWLDYADDRYDRRLIEDVKSVLKVLKLFIPLPFFWALFDQQGSRWTFQAKRMDGEVFGYLIKPDQFQVINPLFILIFIPIFQYAVYPCIAKLFFIRTPLRKLTVGGLLAGLAFVISGILEFSLEKTYPVQPSSGLAQIRIFNTLNCRATINIDNHVETLEALEFYQNLSIPVAGSTQLKFSAEYKDCPPITDSLSFAGTLEAKEETAISWALTKNGLSRPFNMTVDKSKTGDPYVSAVVFMDDGSPDTSFLKIDDNHNFTIRKELNFTDFKEVDVKDFSITIDGQKVIDASLKFGGVYTIVGYVSGSSKVAKIVTVADPNSVHMFWLLPQYIVITMGEVMFSITGLEFAFSQAPTSMKSLLQAGWLLTVAFGNLIVVIIAELHFFKRQVFEFFLFAGLMFADMFIFAIMAKFYKYSEVSSNTNSSTEDFTLETKKKSINGMDNDTFSADL